MSSSRVPNLHPAQGPVTGMRKISRRIFGGNKNHHHSSSKHSSEEEVDESAGGSPAMSAHAAGHSTSTHQSGTPGIVTTGPTPGDGQGCNSSTSGRSAHQRTSSPDPAAANNNLLDLEPLVTQLKEQRDESTRLQEELHALKTQHQSDCNLLHQSLQEERYRFERIEEQMNDLIELHQNEIENLKQGIADMEEKIQYQSEERLRDVYEMLESCQTRVSRMEHQQHQHLQQLVNLDSLENSNARALVLKLINVLLTILQVVLLLVATVANIITPFLHTRIRILTTLVFLLLMVLVFRNRKEFTIYVRENLSERFPLIQVLLNTQEFE